MSTSKNKVILRSSDGETFEVDEAVASESVTIKNMIEDVSLDNAIPLPNVDGEILSKVIEYCKKHVQSTPKSDAVKEELKKFDAEFVKVDHNTLFDLVLAANYLNIKGLLGLICQTIADMIKDRSPEEVRTLFNIENDYTQEEEEAVRNQNAWAFE